MARKWKVKTNAKEVAALLNQLSKVVNKSRPEFSKKICRRIRNKANEILEGRMQHEKGTFQRLKGEPVRTIQNSWHIKESKQGATLWNSARHAKWAEYGTGPITPNSGRYLMFKTLDGEWVRRGWVRGQPPKLYFHDAVEKVKEEMANLVNYYLQRMAPQLRT